MMETIKTSFDKIIQRQCCDNFKRLLLVIHVAPFMTRNHDLDLVFGSRCYPLCIVVGVMMLSPYFGFLPSRSSFAYFSPYALGMSVYH